MHPWSSKRSGSQQVLTRGVPLVRARTRMLALLVTSTVVVTAPVAVRPAAAAPVPALAAAATDPYRTAVRRIADKDPRWEVSTAAWSALISDQPTAVADFLSTPGGGYEKAR